MRRDARAAQLVEHVRALAQERPTINGFLNGDEYSRGMGIVTATDPAAIINAKAIAEGWPFRCDPDLAFARPDLNLLRDVWHSHQTTSAMSEKALFEAPAIKPVARHITVMERTVAEGRARYRVKYQGSYLAALMGSNLDKFVDENIPAQLLPHWHLVFDNVLDSGAPIRLVIAFEFARLNFAAAEAFIAPLSNGAGKVNLVLAGIYFRPRDTDIAEADQA
jgi:hypothetical protein